MNRLRNGPEFLGGARSASPGEGSQTATLRSSGRGSYAATVTINGKSVRGIIDTGATSVGMGARTATELGIAYSAGRQVQIRTANGVITGRAVMLDAVSVENITLHNVEATVSEGDHPLLVGMSFLSRVTMTSSGGAMTLVKR